VPLCQQISTRHRLGQKDAKRHNRTLLAGTSQHHNTPLQNPPEAAPDEIEVQDPRHPLFGRRFEVLSISQAPHDSGHVLVAYGDGLCLRIAVAATNLNPTPNARLRTKVTRAAMLDVLALLKECEGSCIDHPGTSGVGSPSH
jgi:hypothetical protein